MVSKTGLKNASKAAGLFFVFDVQMVQESLEDRLLLTPVGMCVFKCASRTFQLGQKGKALPVQDTAADKARRTARGALRVLCVSVDCVSCPS